MSSGSWITHFAAGEHAMGHRGATVFAGRGSCTLAGTAGQAAGRRRLAPNGGVQLLAQP